MANMIDKMLFKIQSRHSVVSFKKYTLYSQYETHSIESFGEVKEDTASVHSFFRILYKFFLNIADSMSFV